MKWYTIEFYIEAEENLTISDIDMRLYGALKHCSFDWGTGKILEITNAEDEEE